MPGRKAAVGDTKNRPKYRVGITPESLNKPQYSRVSSDGSIHSAPTNKQPNLL